MPFFADTALAWAPHGEALLPYWNAGVWLAIGHTAASLAGLRRFRDRAAAMAAALLAMSLVPERPLSWMTGGQPGVLTDQALSVLLLLVLSVPAVVWAWRKPSLHRALPAWSGMVLAVLCLFYHTVLVYAVDTVGREAQEARLARLLDRAPGFEALVPMCETGAFVCGVGVPQGFDAAFERDLVTYIEVALPGGREGVVAGSNGTPALERTYVWAARQQDGEMWWVYMDWTRQTQGTTLAMAILGLAAVGFWVPFPFVVEAFHRRRAKRPAAARS